MRINSIVQVIFITQEAVKISQTDGIAREGAFDRFLF